MNEKGLWMINVNHPCYEIDTTFARTIEDAEILLGQGYYPISYLQEVIELGKKMYIQIELNLMEYQT